MPSPQIVSREAWLKARKALLAEEKQFDHARDRLTEMRRALPAVAIDKPYVFEGPSGNVSLRDLFAGRRQLIVYHFMFEPTRTTGCKHCSCVMDNVEGAIVHLGSRDTSFAAISRAPIQKIMAFNHRMQWKFPWVSSFESDFNYDFQVTLDPERGSTTYNYRRLEHRGEMPGLSAFLIDADQVLHTYSTYFRGLDMLLPLYHLLDRTHWGRQEDKTNSMAAGEASWIRYHDAYDGSRPDRGACCK